jgi:tRNA(fMet)-specific endonuclease VapC
MARELILLDTSVLIAYFRNKNKKNSEFYQLVAAKKYAFAVSVITEYEIYVGATEDQKEFWDSFFAKVRLLEFDSQCAKEAVRIQQQLKKNNKMIAIPDLLIGATAKSKGLKIATKNMDHFQRIPDLQINEE